MKKTSIVVLAPLVYGAKPSSACRPFSRSSRYAPLSTSRPPKPICGMGMPVISSDRKMAGTMYAKISTQYCTTWV